MKYILTITMIFLTACFSNISAVNADNKTYTKSSIEELTVYTNPRCGYCKRLEAFLDKNKVPYTRKDVTSDEIASKEFYELGGSGTPFSILKTKEGTQKIKGYNTAIFSAIAAAYK